MLLLKSIHLKQITICLLFLIITNCSLQSRLRFFQYCTYLNYPVQQHTIRTDDGYNLRYFRLQKKNTTITSGKRVIYLQHGLADSSDTFIVNSEDKAPAFYFANLGYDVWVGNVRGNRYSNAALSPNIKNYWDFSFDDIAKHDLGAAFRYITNITQRKVHYVGHSQGTLIMFIALSMKYPNIQNNIETYSALGPVVYLNDLESAFLLRLMKYHILDDLAKTGDKVIMYQSDLNLQIQTAVCLKEPIVCAAGLIDISEKNNTVNNLERLPIIMGHFPAGTSVKNFVQFQQYVKSGKFCKYDYGAKQNMKRYNSTEPPIYNISNIDIPVHLFVGHYDKLATVTDNKRLYNQLVNAANRTYTELKFGHATFIWGKSVEHLQKVDLIIKEHEDRQQIKNKFTNNILKNIFEKFREE